MTLWHVLFKCVFFPWIFEAKNSTRWPPRFKVTAEFHHLELSLKNHGSPKLGMGGNGTYVYKYLADPCGFVSVMLHLKVIGSLGFPFPLFFFGQKYQEGSDLPILESPRTLCGGGAWRRELFVFFGADQPETQEKSHVFYGLNSMLIPDAQESSWTWLLTINSKALGKKKSYIFINQQVASIAPEKKKKNNNTPGDAAAVTFFYPQTLEVTFSQPLKSVRNKHPKKGYRQSIASQYLFSPDVSPTCVESFGWWEFLVQKVA